MAIINIAVGRSKYQINCEDGQESKIGELASKLNEKINRLSLGLRGADEKTLLLICSIALLEEIESLKNKTNYNLEIFTSKPGQDNFADITYPLFEELKIQIENLANKIKNY